MAMLRESVAVAMRPAATAEAKLALLEEVQRCNDAASAAQRALEWLVAHGGAERTVFAAPDRARGELICVAGAGVTLRALKRFTLPLDNSHHPVVAALMNGAAPSIKNSKESHIPFFDADSYTAVAVGRSRDTDASALGLLLISPAPEPTQRAAPDVVQWLAGVLGTNLERLTGHEARSDQDVKLRRERALLYNIINAATDPILFTNTEGRLIIANGRAENLFSAPDDASEGRRRAVQLNNMFFSAALSTTALDEGEPGRRELLLVDPTEGSDLLFELLSTAVTDPRQARASSRFSETSPTSARLPGRSTRTTRSCGWPRAKSAPSATG